MPHRCTRTTASLLALIAGSLAGSAAMTGCSDRGADSRKVAEAARELGSVGHADSPSSQGGYTAVSQKIGSIEVGSDAASAVTAGLLGQSLQGAGSVAAKNAALAERSVIDDIHLARGLASRHASLITEAETLESFDPTEDLERIDEETRELEAAAREARSERAALAERMEGLRAQIDELSAQSEQKRNRAAEMELASASLSATEAAARAGTIRQLSREADALDMRIARLRGEIETLSPRLTEFDAEIDKYNQQIELAAEAADDLRQMETERSARAQTARQDAAALAERIRETVNAIDTARGETIVPAGDEAVSALERAVRESEKAARAVRSPGTLGKASAQRRLAEIYQLRADGYQRYADLLAALAELDGLANASAFGTASSEEAATAADFRGQAADAYEAAASSLSSVNIRGTDSAKAQETADKLNELARQLRGEPATQPAANQPADQQPANQPENQQPARGDDARP